MPKPRLNAEFSALEIDRLVTAVKEWYAGVIGAISIDLHPKSEAALREQIEKCLHVHNSNSRS